MPRASKTNGRKEKDLSVYEAYQDKLISAVFAHISSGGYVGIAHSYGSGIRLYVSYEDEKEQFNYDDPEHLDLVGDELHEWRREVLDARRARGPRGSAQNRTNARSGASGRKDGQQSF